MMAQTSLFDLSDCTLCPRECHADRTSGRLGFCQTPGVLTAARAAKLYYEEPCISGKAGSGAVFFSGCSLGCTFCQNYDLSRGEKGAHSISREISPEHLSEIFFSLEEQGASNVNLVTASHLLPLVIPALSLAKTKGLRIPVVYNTSSYEKVEAIQALEGLVDIYLPDLKFFAPALSRRYCSAPDYFDRASAVIREMVRQCPEPVFADGSHALDEEDDADDPLMLRGVIVRHLCMPGCTEDSKQILSWLHDTFGDRIFVSIMNQYTPMPQCSEDPLLSRPLSAKEYDEVTDYAVEIGIENGFLQEGGTVSKSFIPSFDGTGI